MFLINNRDNTGDQKGRINGCKTPGAEWVEYIYDRVGNPVMWQDGNLRQTGSFMACAFDRLGRQVYSAIVPDSRSITTIRGEWMTRYAPAEFSGASGSLYGYSPVFPGIGADDLLTVNYYDGYSFLDFMSGDSLAYSPRSGYGTMPAATGGNLPAKGRLTGTLTRVLGADADEAMLLTAMYYDGRGRVVQSHATNHRGGRDSWYHSLSFDGRPMRMLHIHATADTTVTDEYRYTYDTSCRPVATYLSRDGAPEQRLEQLTYGHTGLVASRSLLDSQSPLTYTYDVHGWLTGIAGGEFAQTLRYDRRADGSAGYLNGNIASSTVTNGRFMRGATADTYEYRYDHADRLVGADFSSKVTTASSMTPDPYCRDTEIPDITAYSYDRNGNITSLTRRGPTGTEPGLFPGSVNTVYGAVDSLVIALDGNRLLKVDDLADDSYSEPSMDFFDGDDQPVEYTYDANGNLTSDLNKGITSITYNAVDRPETVTFDDGHQIRFTWDATGRKLAASYLVDRRTTLSPVAGIESDSLGSHGAADLSTMLTRHYCGEHIYADNRLERTITPVGYIDGTSGCHYAYIRDHQGNNRATLSADGWHTSVMKYYPFGAATWHGDQADRYRFGGKELDRTLGLDLYDFEARMYDPVLARFCQPDPMAWKYTWLSPYAYCANNPIRYIDPSGQNWYENNWGSVIWTNYESQNDLDTNHISGKYLGEAHVVFNGSVHEKLGTLNGKEGYINGENAVTADVIVYGPNSADDITLLTGFTMTSNFELYGAISEGLYDANYDIIGKSGNLKSHWVLNYRGEIPTMNNAPNLSPYAGENYGKPIKTGVFIHSTNASGYAGGNISTACLLISPLDFKKFNEIMAGVQNFTVRVTREQIVKVPLLGINGIVPNISILQKIIRK